MANRKKPQSRVPDDETPEARFRRVIDERVRPLVKRFDQITNMVTQPSYAPTKQDLQKVVTAITVKYEQFLAQYQKAIDGEKAGKTFTGVDWEASTEEETSDQEPDLDKQEEA